MAFFNWFSRKAADGAIAGIAAPTMATAKGETDPGRRNEDRKAHRHARREKLYLAIRESMTRGGVLASSYKFKVLSLDQRGRQFLVMMDVSRDLGRQTEKLVQLESMVMESADARYDIDVTSVYWRVEPLAAFDLGKPPAPDTATSAPQSGLAPDRLVATKPTPHPYEQIHADEVMAFKQALAAAAPSHPVRVDADGKSRSGPHSYTLLTGFEDTELPESAALPALSNTQYGELG